MVFDGVYSTGKSVETSGWILMVNKKNILWFDELCLDDLPLVGGKNASLGEMISGMKDSGVHVPSGFAISAAMYRDFIRANGLDQQIAKQLSALNRQEKNLNEVGLAIRIAILAAEFTAPQRDAIVDAYQRLCTQINTVDAGVAVRSSATAEDLPEASFAGQQESYLNICGADLLLEACRNCYASLYTDRAIAYRLEQGFDDMDIALSIGVQQMVRSDLACAGVMFTLDTESGFPEVVTISGAWGLGESVVKGSVNPDRFMVYKPLLDKASLAPVIERSCGSKLEKMVYRKNTVFSADGEQNQATPVISISTLNDERSRLVLTDQEVLQLARWGVAIEQHYGRCMDIEWAKDGNSGQLFIVQARPETVESQKDQAVLQSYQLQQKSKLLLEGASVGSAIACGQVCYLSDPTASADFPEGGILVTERTDPDWVPVMRKAAGIITDAGGPTSHAAIVSRELKVPAVVGAGKATALLKNGMEVTMDCASGSVAKVYDGSLKFSVKQIQLDDIPTTKTALMINVAMPDGAMRWWQLPVAGIGLTRIEFIISSQIRIHPMALLHPEEVVDVSVRENIQQLTQGYHRQQDYFVDKLALGIGKIAASCYPLPAVIRFSDFKSNEYRGLLGGEYFEPEEENPMLGLRGASRYYHPRYREAFQLECQAVKRVREQMGFSNVIVMVPFCRTPKEADEVLAVMASAGLQRGENGLQVYVMCEIPSNIILAEQFCQRFDGFSIGSNDLTQLILGIDRDASELNYLFDARDEAVKRMIVEVIKVAHENHCKVGICGQAPSDHPEFAEFLVNAGIDSISLNPDSIVQAAHYVSAAELGGASKLQTLVSEVVN